MHACSTESLRAFWLCSLYLNSPGAPKDAHFGFIWLKLPQFLYIGFKLLSVSPSSNPASWSYTKAICPRITHISFLFFKLINPRSLIHFSYFINGFQYWPHRKIIWELKTNKQKKTQCLENSQEKLNQDLCRLDPGTDIFESSPGNSRCTPKLENHCTYFQFVLCWLLYS